MASEEAKLYGNFPLPPISSRNNHSSYSFNMSSEQHIIIEDEKEDNEIYHPRPLEFDLWNGIDEIIISEEDVRFQEMNGFFGFDGDEEIKEEIQVEISVLSGISEDVKNFSSSVSNNLHSSTVRDERWMCPVCLELLEDPVETPCCHNLFCEKCVINIRKCPLCSQNLGQCQPNIPIRRLMEDLAVKCRHARCEVIIRKADLINHEKTCEMALVPCQNSFLCGEVLRKDIEKHLKDECSYRPVLCSLECGKILPYSDIEKHIEEECLNFIINCPQKCGTLIQRGETDMHISQVCPYTYIKCNLIDTDSQSCTVICMREELEDHRLICEFKKSQCPNSGCYEKFSKRLFLSHNNICRFKQIHCPNNCQELILRKDIDNHSILCPLKIIECPYKEFGCTVKIERKILKEHLEDEAVYHSLKMVEGCKENKLAIEKMQLEFQVMKEMFKQELLKIGDEMNIIRCQRRENERARIEWYDEEPEGLVGGNNKVLNSFDDFLRMLER
ncbi:unnamed protein product [Blepharisma stoltei]|uniref:Uncharacterized protein n=1 Tax=Blepharisma stoltei TaxID=1481888 RepID=A0AAU9INK0_9CILI|nr:unnamed protein product [Blepharisma stoltei]